MPKAAEFVLSPVWVISYFPTKRNNYPVGEIRLINIGITESELEESGHLVCDGSLLAISEFPELFSVIGYKYGGSGDYFNLPCCPNF